MKKFNIDTDEILSMEWHTVRTFLKVLDNVRYDIVETALNSDLTKDDMVYLSWGKAFAEQLIKEIYKLYEEWYEIKNSNIINDLTNNNNQE